MTQDNETVARLEALEAKATAGPWHWVDGNTDIPWDGQSELWNGSLRTVEEFGKNETIERDGKHYTTWALPKWIIGSGGDPFPNPADGLLIAALRNEALPALRSLSTRLAAAEARVRELEYALYPMKRGASEADYYCGHDVPGDHEVLITVSIEELRAARAALHPEKPADIAPAMNDGDDK